jgi:hypothetical protein
MAEAIREKYRSVANWRAKWRLETAELRGRKDFGPDGLRSSTVRSEHREMAVWAFEKTANFYKNRHFFVDFPRVFPWVCADGFNLGARDRQNRFRRRRVFELEPRRIAAMVATIWGVNDQ